MSKNQLKVGQLFLNLEEISQIRIKNRVCLLINQVKKVVGCLATINNKHKEQIKVKAKVKIRVKHKVDKVKDKLSPHYLLKDKEVKVKEGFKNLQKILVKGKILDHYFLIKVAKVDKVDKVDRMFKNHSSSK